jgi:hypothetical protein
VKTSLTSFLIFALLLCVSASTVFAADAVVPLKPIRGEIIINRTNSPWESQQVQEPCILPNPKDPTRLVMFYSGVPATNRDLWCFECNRLIATLPDCESIYIPSQPTAAGPGR